MNKWFAGLIGLLVASPLAVVALDAVGIGPGFEVEAPVWESGYTWDYKVRGEGRAGGMIIGVAQGESETVRLDATRRAEVLNTTGDAAGAPVYTLLENYLLNSVRYGDTVLYDAATETGDAQTTAGGLDDMMVCFLPCATTAAQYTQQHLDLVLSDEPFADGRSAPETMHLLDFPLTRGKTWNVVSYVEPQYGFIGEVTAEAVEKEYLPLPGRDPVQAIRIEAELSEVTKHAVRTAVREAAAEEDFELDVDLGLTLTYWYAPEIRNIVQMEVDGFFAGRGSGLGAAGMFRVDVDMHWTLTGAQLVAKPERPIAQADALAQATWVDHPLRSGASPEPWPFHVAATDVAVNSADAPTVQLGVIEGWDGHDKTDLFPDTIPDGSTVEWTHRYWADGGPVTERLTGDTITVTLSDPGIHVFHAQVLDANGGLRGADELAIEAYTHETFTLDEPLGLPTGAGTEWTFPMAPGASRATYAVDGGELTRGTLAFMAPSGQGHEERVDGDTEGRIDTFLEPGTWTATWHDDVRVGAMDLEVEVRYEPPTHFRHHHEHGTQSGLQPLSGAFDALTRLLS